MRENVFFSPAEMGDLLADGGDWLGAYCDLYEARMVCFDDPAQEAFHLWRFMPPPSYGRVVALPLPAEAAYRPPFRTSKEGLVVLRLPDEGATAVLEIGAIRLRMKRRPEGTRIAARTSYLQKPVVLNETSNYLRVSWRLVDAELIIGVNGKLLLQSPNDTTAIQSALWAPAGQVGLVSIQSLSPTRAFVHFDAAHDAEHLVFEDEPNPFRFDWGLRSIRIYTSMLMGAFVRDAAQAAASGVDLGVSAGRIHDLDRRFASTRRELLDALLDWPRWRPSVGQWPEAGPWDRNSFSNGVIPALVALLARMEADAASSGHVADTIDRKAGAFFASQQSLHFLKTGKSRNANWWMKRSANHGMIMNFGYLIAMHLIGQEDHPTAKLVEEMAATSFLAHYRDGSFPEGFHYSNFALSHAFPYIHLVNESNSSVARMRELFPHVYEWWSLSLEDRPRVMANFGDNVDVAMHAERSSVGHFLRCFARSDLGELVDESAVDPFTPFARGRRPRVNRARGLVVREFAVNRFALATHLDASGRRTSGLFVIGSRLQLTHNRNHDCAGFAFYGRGARVSIAQAELQPYGNNAVGFMDGETMLLFEGRRDYNGAVSVRASEDGASVVIVAEVSAEAPLSGRGPTRFSISREFLYMPATDPILSLRTSISGVDGLSPYLAFNFESGAEDAALELHCFVRQAGAAWTSVRSSPHGATRLFLSETPKDPTQFLTVLSASLPDPRDVEGALNRAS